MQSCENNTIGQVRFKDGLLYTCLLAKSLNRWFIYPISQTLVACTCRPMQLKIFQSGNIVKQCLQLFRNLLHIYTALGMLGLTHLPVLVDGFLEEVLDELELLGLQRVLYDHEADLGRRHLLAVDVRVQTTGGRRHTGCLPWGRDRERARTTQ